MVTMQPLQVMVVCTNRTCKIGCSQHPQEGVGSIRSCSLQQQCVICSVHVPVYLLQEWVQPRILCFLDVLHQLSVFGDQLPQVGQFLQQSGKQEVVIGVVGQQVEPQHLDDALLQLLHQRHVHQAWAVCGEGIRQRNDVRKEGSVSRFKI